MRLERLNWREAEAYFKTHDLVLLMRLEQTH